MITIVSYPTNTEQAPRGRGGTVHPIILDLGTRWVCVCGQQHVTAVPNPVESTALPIKNEAGWASKVVWTQKIH